MPRKIDTDRLLQTAIKAEKTGTTARSTILCENEDPLKNCPRFKPGETGETILHNLIVTNSEWNLERK